MKNKKEICEYLNIDGNTLSDFPSTTAIIVAAKSIEKKYKKELSSGEYGYALQADFYSTPFILEDEAKYSELKEIENVDGLVVYKIVSKIRDGFRECLYDCNTLDETIKFLQECYDKGLKRYIEFNGEILYSDTVTFDSAYEKITGKSYAAFNKEREEEIAEFRRADEEFKAKIPKLTQFYIQKGHEILDCKYWAEWDKCVPVRLNDIYKGKELETALDLIQMLNENKPFSEVSAAFDSQGFSGMSEGLMKLMLISFHDRGQEFANTLS